MAVADLLPYVGGGKSPWCCNPGVGERQQQGGSPCREVRPAIVWFQNGDLHGVVAHRARETVKGVDLFLLFPWAAHWLSLPLAHGATTHLL